MISNKHLESDARLASAKIAEHSRAAGRKTRPQRVSWKRVLGKIVSPAFRLHHYREAHNRLLQHALCELDSAVYRECGGK